MAAETEGTSTSDVAQNEQSTGPDCAKKALLQASDSLEGSTRNGHRDGTVTNGVSDVQDPEVTLNGHLESSPANAEEDISHTLGLNGVQGVYHYPKNGEGRNYPIPETYHSQKSKIRVACIGAGPSGLCLAYKMERQMQPGSWELTLYDKNDEIGGTWLENK